jgi:hypothetical protein
VLIILRFSNGRPLAISALKSTAAGRPHDPWEHVPAESPRILLKVKAQSSFLLQLRPLAGTEFSMKARLSLLLTLVTLNSMSCGREDELDQAIHEALDEGDSEPSVYEPVSIRYYTEDKAR